MGEVGGEVTRQPQDNLDTGGARRIGTHGISWKSGTIPHRALTDRLLPSEEVVRWRVVPELLCSADDGVHHEHARQRTLET